MTTQEVLENLINIYHENRLSHAYLVETNNKNLALKDINYFIKNIICPSKFTNSCTKCNFCHLIENNSLPSVIYVYPDGKTIKKDQIEVIKNKFSSKSIYTNYNIYVIIEPELMNDTAFNRMLKFIEEPEDNIIGFFVTTNKDKMPDTIVSRLSCVRLIYDDIENDSISLDEETKAVIEDVFKGFTFKIFNYSELLCYNVDVIQKKLTEKVDIICFFNMLLDYFKVDLKDDYSKANELCNLVIKYLDRLNYNVNIPLLLDSFVAEMGQIYEQ